MCFNTFAVQLHSAMIKEFKQKRGRSERNFILYEDRINFFTKTPKETARYDIKLQELGFDLHYHTAKKTNRMMLYIFNGLMFGLMLLILIFDEKREGTLAFVVLGIPVVIISAVELLKKDTDDLYLVGGNKKLVFYRAIPDEQSVLDFIAVINTTQRQLLKTKYTAFTNRTSAEEYDARLAWLKEIEAITEEEHGQLMHNFEISKLLE